MKTRTIIVNLEIETDKSIPKIKEDIRWFWANSYSTIITKFKANIVKKKKK